MIADPNYQQELSNVQENNRIREESINQLDTIFIAFLHSHSSLENKFLVGLQVDYLELNPNEVMKKYKLSHKKIKEYLMILQLKLKAFVS